MQANQNIGFIDLTEDDGSSVKIQAGMIQIMKRFTNEGEIPVTTLFMMNGHSFNVLETPEQIAKLQEEQLEDMMKTITMATKKIMEELTEEDPW